MDGVTWVSIPSHSGSPYLLNQVYSPVPIIVASKHIRVLRGMRALRAFFEPAEGHMMTPTTPHPSRCQCRTSRWQVVPTHSQLSASSREAWMSSART